MAIMEVNRNEYPFLIEDMDEYFSIDELDKLATKFKNKGYTYPKFVVIGSNLYVETREFYTFLIKYFSIFI